MNTQAVKRRRRRKLQTYLQRLDAELGTGRSDRSRAKAAARETAMDQVPLDKERGLEIGRVARKTYREAPRRAKEARQRPRSRGAREADTYRGARRKAERGTRMALVFRAERQRTGETRQQADRRRREAGAR